MGPLRMRLRNYLQVLASQWLLHYWPNPGLHDDKSSSYETPADMIPGTLIQKCICLFTVNLTRLLDTENNRLKIWMKQNCINIFVSCWRIWSSDNMFKEAVVAQLLVPPRVSLEGMGQTATNLKWGQSVSWPRVKYSNREWKSEALLTEPSSSVS
jgi:hypothetical protein